MADTAQIDMAIGETLTLGIEVEDTILELTQLV